MNKKILGLCLTLILATSASTHATQNYVDLKVGTGEGIIGYTQAESNAELEKRGPESFAITNDGRIIILDTIDNQIEIFDKSGSSLKTITLEDGETYFDVESDNMGNIYALSYSGMISIFNKEFQLESNYLLETDVEGVNSMFYSLYKNKENNIVLRNIKIFTEKPVIINSKNSLMMSTEQQGVLDGINFNTKNSSIRESTAFSKEESSIEQRVTEEINENTRIEPLAVADSGEVYLLEQTVSEGSDLEVENKVKVVSKSDDKYFYSEANSDQFSYPKKSLYVTKDGQVYQMQPLSETLVIKKLESSELKTNDWQVNIAKPMRVSTRAVSSIAYNAMQEADKMAGYEWTYEPATMKTPTGTYTLAPEHLRGSSTTSEVGIPYKWGGFDNITAFSDKLSDGKTAGDIRAGSTSAYTVSSCTGIDCSGFISRAYGFSSKLGTSTIPSYFSEIEWWELQQGDIANKNGHVWMYVWRNYDYLGRFVAYTTLESTVGGPEDKAKEWYKTPDEASAYTPMTKN